MAVSSSAGRSIRRTTILSAIVATIGGLAYACADDLGPIGERPVTALSNVTHSMPA